MARDPQDHRDRHEHKALEKGKRWVPPDAGKPAKESIGEAIRKAPQAGYEAVRWAYTFGIDSVSSIGGFIGILGAVSIGVINAAFTALGVVWTVVVGGVKGASSIKNKISPALPEWKERPWGVHPEFAQLQEKRAQAFCKTFVDLEPFPSDPTPTDVISWAFRHSDHWDSIVRDDPNYWGAFLDTTFEAAGEPVVRGLFMDVQLSTMKNRTAANAIAGILLYGPIEIKREVEVRTNEERVTFHGDIETCASALAAVRKLIESDPGFGISFNNGQRKFGMADAWDTFLWSTAGHPPLEENSRKALHRADWSIRDMGVGDLTLLYAKAIQEGPRGRQHNQTGPGPVRSQGLPPTPTPQQPPGPSQTGQGPGGLTL